MTNVNAFATEAMLVHIMSDWIINYKYGKMT